jgi:hypothetical protein
VDYYFSFRLTRRMRYGAEQLLRPRFALGPLLDTISLRISYRGAGLANV